MPADDLVVPLDGAAAWVNDFDGVAGRTVRVAWERDQARNVRELAATARYADGTPDWRVVLQTITDAELVVAGGLRLLSVTSSRVARAAVRRAFRWPEPAPEPPPPLPPAIAEAVEAGFRAVAREASPVVRVVSLPPPDSLVSTVFEHAGCAVDVTVRHGTGAAFSTEVDVAVRPPEALSAALFSTVMVLNGPGPVELTAEFLDGLIARARQRPPRQPAYMYGGWRNSAWASLDDRLRDLDLLDPPTIVQAAQAARRRTPPPFPGARPEPTLTTKGRRLNLEED